MVAERKIAGCVSDKRQMKLAHSPGSNGESQFRKPSRIQSGEREEQGGRLLHQCSLGNSREEKRARLK